MLQWITDFVTKILNSIIAILTYPVKIQWAYPIYSEALMKFGGMVYTFLCMPFYLVLDFLNMFFRRVCGLEGHVSFGTDATNGQGQILGEGEDLVMAFITSKPVMDVFISLSLIAVVLLFISTIIAIVKTEYTFDKAGNSKAPIFARAIKAVVLYLTIPAACVLGIYFSNMMLKAVDQATKPGGNMTISGMLFRSSCQRANRVNHNRSFALLYQNSELINAKWYFNKSQSISNGSIVGGNYGNESKPFQLLEDPTNCMSVINYTEANQLAALIDAAFANGVTDYTKYNLLTVLCLPDFGPVYASLQAASKFKGLDFVAASNIALDGAAHLFSITPLILAGFSIYNLDAINFYYDFLTFDYLQVVIVGGIIAKTLLDITVGVAKRLYEMVVLFVISPPVVALMPLDEGQAYKIWAKEFISRVFSLYGGVLAMNFFFMISPMVCQINFFPDIKLGSADVKIPAILGSFLSYMPSLIFVTAGALSIKSISKMLSGLISSKDSLSEGAELTKEMGSAIVKGVSVVAGGAKFAGKIAGEAMKFASNKIKKSGDGGNGGGDGKDADEKAAAAEIPSAAANTAGAPTGGSPVGSATTGEPADKEESSDETTATKIKNVVKKVKSSAIMKNVGGMAKMMGGTIADSLGFDSDSVSKTWSSGGLGKIQANEKKAKEKKAAEAKEQAANEAQQNFRNAILGNMAAEKADREAGIAAQNKDKVIQAKEKELLDTKMMMDAELENERYDIEKEKADFIKRDKTYGGKLINDARTEAYQEHRARSRQEKEKTKIVLDAENEKADFRRNDNNKILTHKAMTEAYKDQNYIKKIQQKIDYISSENEGLSTNKKNNQKIRENDERKRELQSMIDEIKGKA